MTILKMKNGTIKKTKGMKDALNKLDNDVDIIITNFKNLYYEFNKMENDNTDIMASGNIIIKSDIEKPENKIYYDLLIETHMLNI